MSTFLFVVVICLLCETFFWGDKNKNLLIPGKALKTGQTKNATDSNYWSYLKEYKGRFAYRSMNDLEVAASAIIKQPSPS